MSEVTKKQALDAIRNIFLAFLPLSPQYTTNTIGIKTMNSKELNSMSHKTPYAPNKDIC